MLSPREFRDLRRFLFSTTLGGDDEVLMLWSMQSISEDSAATAPTSFLTWTCRNQTVQRAISVSNLAHQGSVHESVFTLDFRRLFLRGTRRGVEGLFCCLGKWRLLEKGTVKATDVGGDGGGDVGVKSVTVLDDCPRVTPAVPACDLVQALFGDDWCWFGVSLYLELLGQGTRTR